MRALIQRVKGASISVDGILHNHINKGLLIFLGITHSDTNEDARYLAQRCVDLRIFEDGQGKMNLSVRDISGEILIISQFTLYADTRRGNRPSFTDAAAPEMAERLYNNFVDYLRVEFGEDRIKTGVFRAIMDVQLINDGPVTVQIESKNNNR